MIILFYFIILVVFSHFFIFLISQNLINLLVVFLLFVMMKRIYQKSLFDSFILRDKEQGALLNLLTKLRILNCYYIRHIELELFWIVDFFIKMKETIEKGIRSQEENRIKNYEYLINLSIQNTLDRLIENQKQIGKLLS